MPHRLRWTHVVAAIAIAAGPAAADTARHKVSAAYETGLDAFEAEQFEKALHLFDRAYLLDNAPVPLFDMARVAEAMGNGERAVDEYDRDVDRVSDAPDRGEVERGVRESTTGLSPAPIDRGAGLVWSGRW